MYFIFNSIDKWEEKLRKVQKEKSHNTVLDLKH